MVDRVDKHWCWQVRNQTPAPTVEAAFRDIDFEGRGSLLLEDLTRELNLKKRLNLRNMDVLRLFRRLTQERTLSEGQFARALAR
jgi:hypothetical protein